MEKLIINANSDTWGLKLWSSIHRPIMIWYELQAEHLALTVLHYLDSDSAAAGPQSAQSRRGPDGGRPRGGPGRGHQLAALSGSCLAAVGHHLSQGTLSHHRRHQREAALPAHLRWVTPTALRNNMVQSYPTVSLSLLVPILLSTFFFHIFAFFCFVHFIN